MMSAKILAAATVFVASSVQAEYWTGNDLFRHLNGDTTEQLVAYGYIAGVADAGQKTNHCIPRNVTLRQIVDLTQQALAAGAALRHNTSADSFISYQLNRVWPCRQGSSL